MHRRRSRRTTCNHLLPFRFSARTVEGKEMLLGSHSAAPVSNCHGPAYRCMSRRRWGHLPLAGSTDRTIGGIAGRLSEYTDSRSLGREGHGHTNCLPRAVHPPYFDWQCRSSVSGSSHARSARRWRRPRQWRTHGRRSFRPIPFWIWTRVCTSARIRTGRASSPSEGARAYPW